MKKTPPDPLPPNGGVFLRHPSGEGRLVMHVHGSVRTGFGRVMEWEPISSAPFDRDLELAVIGYDGEHALVFPCRRILGGWIDAATKQRIDVNPSHWREWDTGP